jgi:serine kinase of HPr protein (carbohydrate metabolism regulator)
VSEILHATLVAVRLDGRWRGALIRGASGAGKSTLALRCLDAGFALVADDRVVSWTSGGKLYGKAPGPLAGLIEVRGVGVTVVARTLAFGPVDLVLDLASGPPDQAIERMPEPETVEIGGLGISRLVLSAGDPNAVLRLSAALAASQHGV